MTSSNDFNDFADKVRFLITSSADSQAILDALRDLAHGRPARLLDTEIEPLPGLGQHGLSDSSGRYLETMTRLLTWGMRLFPIDSTVKGQHLWVTMDRLDGRHGYNQEVLWSDTGFAMQIEVAPGVFTLSSTPAPHVVMEGYRDEAVQPLQGNLQYVIDYLVREPGARAVVATAFRFGWRGLSVPCTCLYVEADDSKCRLVQSPGEETPTIIITCKVEDLTPTPGDTTITPEDADRMMGLENLEGLARSQRLSVLRMHYRNRLRMIEEEQSCVHGQSISLMSGAESKGSIGIFLAAEDSNETYALTAGHVVQTETEERRVISPGSLDIMATLAKCYPDFARHESTVDFVTRKLNHRYGSVEDISIGITTDGWRSDWGLVRLHDVRRDPNGSWFDIQELRDRCAITDGLHDGVELSGDVVGSHDPEIGRVCLKDGATTGCTAGTIGPTQALHFIKGTSDPPGKQADPATVDVATVIPFFSAGGPDLSVCGPGDSGAGVFCPGENGWVWVGQLVSKLSGRLDSVGLVVPQSAVLSSLEEQTGRQWHLAGS